MSRSCWSAHFGSSGHSEVIEVVPLLLIIHPGKYHCVENLVVSHKLPTIQSGCSLNPVLGLLLNKYSPSSALICAIHCLLLYKYHIEEYANQEDQTQMAS